MATARIVGAFVGEKFDDNPARGGTTVRPRVGLLSDNGWIMIRPRVG